LIGAFQGDKHMILLLHPRLLLALFLLSLGAGAGAQTYPDRPIRLVVPFAAGTATDVAARSVALGLGRNVGTIVVDNKPGALGAIGTTEVARAKADGYTLLLGTSTALAAGPQMLKSKPAYDPQNDFVPVGRIAGAVFTLVVRSELGVNNLQEFLALARKRKPGLTWAWANSANLAAGQVLVNEAKLDAVKVGYKGVPQMMQDLLGGTIDFTIVDLANALPQIKAGKLRALAVSTPTEIAELPGVPPLNRVVKDFQLMVWSGLFAPKGTPEPVLAALSEGLKKSLADPEVRGSLIRAGNIMLPGDGAEMRAHLAEDIARWAALIKAANIHPE
jgi:tripartite-type tricarboxylate transporter receptor subunit TctC